MTPANERKAAERQRKKAAGLVRIEAWVPADRKAELIAMIEAELAQSRADQASGHVT